jgi:hypothetical protein
VESQVDCIPDSGRVSSNLSGALLGIRLKLEIPACLQPLFSGLCGTFAVSPHVLCLRARPKGGCHWAVDYGPYNKFGEACGHEALHYTVDKALILELQHRRSDLLFLHAAVLGYSTGAIAVLAASGVGKSTTSLAALQAGLRCYSDELAPLDLERLCVWPYPRALSLKTRPNQRNFRGTPRVHRIGQQWFLPLDSSRVHARNHSIPLRALVILDRVGDECSRIARLSGAKALANVYSHCLNPMAHDNGGLSAVRRLLDALPCYHFSSASPMDTVAFLHHLLLQSGFDEMTTGE